MNKFPANPVQEKHFYVGLHNEINVFPVKILAQSIFSFFFIHFCSKPRTCLTSPLQYFLEQTMGMKCNFLIRLEERLCSSLPHQAFDLVRTVSYMSSMNGEVATNWFSLGGSVYKVYSSLTASPHLRIKKTRVNVGNWKRF